MNPRRVISTVLAVALCALACPALAAPALKAGGPLPLAFEPNVGQADTAVKFLARGRGYGLFLTPTETVLVLSPGDRAGRLARRPGPVAPAPSTPAVVRMRFVGADPNATVSGGDPLPGRSHYFVGGRERWRRDVPTFARVRYSEMYPGIGLVFYGNERQLEYDFIVAPGADPGVVELAFDGAEGLRLDADGDLLIASAAGELRLRRPVIYQDTDSGRRPLEGGYVIDDRRVHFRVAAWDASRPLVIDPVLGYSTYLGGGSNDQGFGIAVDAAGNAYVTGSTISIDFPVAGTPLRAARAGNTDVFVAKLDPTGTTLVYSTYLGGTDDDVGTAIAVDAAGNAYVTGSTMSLDFPPVGAFQPTLLGGSEAFVSKLDPNGSALVYSTFLGSSTNDAAFGIALDSAGNAYVAGSTESATFPNNGAVACQGIKRAGVDAFVARLDASGASLNYCRFVGGNLTDIAQAVAADATGNVWFVGSTTSTDLVTAPAIQATRGGGLDAFAGKLNATGGLVYLTYLGGSLDDEALAVAADSAGNAYVAGSTSSTNFRTAVPLQVALGGALDAFVAKINPAGTALVFSTYLGGGGNDVANGVAVHPTDFTVYVAGATGSADFPIVSPIQDRLAGGFDAFVSKLTAAGSALVYSSYLGGTGDDGAQALAVDADGVAFLTGTTESPAFPTVAPIQNAAGLLDAFVTQVADGGIIQFTAATYQANENAGSVTISVQRTGDVSAAASVEFLTSDGTATAGADYLGASGTLIFAPGQVVAAFTLTLVDDTVGDGDETVTLTLRNPSGGAVLGARRTTTLTLVDNEPAINFSAATFSVVENRGPAVITVTRSGPTGGTVTVQFSTADGGAVAGSDYTAVARTLTFAAGVRSLTVSVPILNDTLAEGTETVNLALSNVSGGTPAAVLGVRSAATLNVTDDDVGGVLQFSAATYSVAETAPTATITVTRTGGAASGVTVDYATSDGTAQAGADYAATTGTLTFGAGQTSRTFTVPIINDTAAEGNETVNLTLSNVLGGGLLGGQRTAVLTIVDDEPTVAFASETFMVQEVAATATITVRRGGAATGAATVDFSTSNGSGIAGVHYTPVSGTLSFPAGTVTRTFTVPIINDTAFSGPRTVRLSLTNATGAVTIVPPSLATLTITDNDVAGTIQLSAPVYVFAENAGSAVITVSRTGGTASGATIDFATSDGTAVAGADYTFTGGTLTFGAGETTRSFTVPLLNDTLAEGVETVNIMLSNAGGGAVVGARSTALLRIVDDELALAFNAPNYAVNEGAGSAVITVELTGVSTGPVTVNFATGNGTASNGLDYTSAAGMLSFPAGGTATGVRTLTFAVPILQDTLAEGVESVNLTLSSPTPTGAGGAQLVTGRSTAVLNIADDDQGGLLEFDVAAADPFFRALENAGTATIRVRRTAGAASGVTIEYATADATATAGLDYTATSGRLTFGAGETLGTFTIPLVNDTLGEGSETVNLTLSNPSGGGALGTQTTAKLEIQDDEPHVKLSAATYTVTEGAAFLTVTVERGGVDTATLTVDYATADQVPAAAGKAVAGVDYTAVAGTLTFGPAVRTRTFTVPIINDAIPEAEDKFDVFLSNPTISAGTVTLVGPNRAEVKITDDDIGGTIQFSAPAYTVNENGGEAVVTITRGGGQAGGVSVLFETGEAFATTPPVPTQTATPGADYTPPAAGTRVTFGAGETSKIVRIPIQLDVANEGVELLNARVSAPEPVGAPGTPIIGPQAIATISIVDAQPTVQFSLAEFAANEGQPVATVTVERTAAFGRVTVDYATSDAPGVCPPAAFNSGRACAGLDYVAAAGTLTFEPGVTSQSFTVRLIDNQAVDADKRLNVTLSNLQAIAPATAAFAPRTTAPVKIRENDRGGVFTVSPGNVPETDAETSTTVTVSRTGGSAGPVQVTFHARTCGIFGTACDFPAIEDGFFLPPDPQVLDFVPTDQVMTFQPGEMSKTATIFVHGNNIPEGLRDIQVSVTDALPSVMQDGQPIGPQATGVEALVRIVEDDLYFVNLTGEAYSAVEGAAEAFVTVVRTGSPNFLAQSLGLEIVVTTGGSTPGVAGQDFIDLGPSPVPGDPPGTRLAAQATAFTMPPNVTTQSFRIPLLDDDVVDGSKTFRVRLRETPATGAGTPTGPGFTFPRSAILTVTDDEVGGTIEFSAATYSEVEDVAGAAATITLSRSGPPKLANQVTVRVQSGDLFGATTPPQTGVVGNDYGSTDLAVTFGAGATTATFQVPLVNDPGDGVKTVNLRISNPAPNIGAAPVLGQRTNAVLRIVDAAPTIGFTLSNFDISEAAGVATIQIERTGDVSAGTAVTFSTLDPPPPTAPTVTAVPGSDYQTVSNAVVTFGPGQTVATVQVPLIDNKVVNPDKIFALRLTNPQPPFVALADARVTLKDDDVAGVIAFGSADFVAQESSGQGIVAIVRSLGTAGCPVPLAGPPPSCPDATLVSFSTADVTATQPGDYTALTNFVVEFGAGELVKLVSVTVTADVLTEGTEKVNLSLSNPLPAGAGVTGRGPTVPAPNATLQIVESEFRIGATAYPASEATGRATITVVRVGDATGISTLGFATVTGTAIPGTDYTGTTGTLTFNPGETVMTLDVVLTDDGIAETDESFDVVLSGPTGSTIARDSCASATPAAPALVATCTVTVNILDNESGGVLSFSQAVYDAPEPAAVATTATITVRRIAGGAGGVTVDFDAIDGTSLSGTAYAITPGTLTFAAGETSKTFTVTIPPNGTLGIQTATLVLRNATGGAIIATPGTATLRITDTGNSVGFETLGYTVDENGGFALITVRRTGSAGDVQVDFATSDGTATAAAGDYTATATTITFPAGATTRTVMVPIGNDGILEPGESLTLTLSNPRLVPSLTAVAVAPDACLTSTATTCTAALQILDDDQGGAIQFTSANYTVNENGGTAMITLTRAGGLAGGVTVTFSATPGTAAPGDFNPPSATVTFAPGQATVAAALTIVDNQVAELDRTVDLAISNPQPTGLAGSPVLGLRALATLVIRDNEPRLAFSAPTFAVTEGTPTATLTVTRTGDATVEALVDFTTSDGSANAGADYTLTAGTLTFPASTTSRALTIPVANDSVLEGTETVFVTLSNPRSNPVSPGRVAVAGTNPATLFINDDDRAGTIAFNASTLSVGEAAGTLTVTVTRTGGNAGGIVVNYSAEDDTALNGTDYVLAAGTVTFGVAETARTFTVTINDRPGAQGNRAFSLVLAPPALPALLGPPSRARVTIVDDEPTFRFSASGYSVAESGVATIIVQRLGNPAGVATVTLQTGDLFAPIGGAGQTAQTATAGADYTSVNRVLTFANGVRSVTVTVPITADTTVEGNETVNLRLTAPTGAAIVNVTDGAAVLTILDNDQGGDIQFSAVTYTVVEGTLAATITIVRTGGTGGPVTVDFETDDGTGTATAGADYTPVRRIVNATPPPVSNPVVFNAGVVSQTVTVPIINDTLDEPAETVLLRLSNPRGGANLGARSTATLTITDNDVAGAVQFSQALYTVSEALTTAVITLTRTGGAASGVTVAFTTSDPGGLTGAQAGTDYTATTTTVTFAANQPSQPVMIPLPGDDALSEGSKFVNLSLANPGGGAVLGARANAVLKIVDNEATVQFAAATYQVMEGGTAAVTLERTGTAGTVIVGFTTSVGGTGTEGVDYLRSTGTVTFAAGVLTRTFPVRTITNGRDEGDRTVNLTLGPVSGITGAVLGPQTTAVLTIVDNDFAGALAFSSPSYSVGEVGFVTLPVRRPANAGAGPVTVAYTTVDGTARAGVDYVAKSGVLTFGPSQFVVNITANILPNTRDDGDRTFTVQLSAPTGGATLGTPSTGVVVIKNNDVAGIVQFSAPAFAVSECAVLPCVAVLFVGRTGNGASGATVDFVTIDGSATALNDYVATTGQVAFAAGQMSARISVPLQIEPGARPLKTFSVILTNPRGGATLGIQSAAEVRITDTR